MFIEEATAMYDFSKLLEDIKKIKYDWIKSFDYRRPHKKIQAYRSLLDRLASKESYHEITKNAKIILGNVIQRGNLNKIYDYSALKAIYIFYAIGARHIDNDTSAFFTTEFEKTGIRVYDISRTLSSGTHLDELANILNSGVYLLDGNNLSVKKMDNVILAEMIILSVIIPPMYMCALCAGPIGLSSDSRGASQRRCTTCHAHYTDREYDHILEMIAVLEKDYVEKKLEVSHAVTDIIGIKSLF